MYTYDGMQKDIKDGGNMNIDFSTITPYGLFALLIICFALIVVFTVIIRAVKTLRVKTENATIEIGKTTEQIKQTVGNIKEHGMTISRDIVKKQSNLAKHHILEMGCDLEEIICNCYKMDNEERNHAKLVLNLFLAELKYQVLNNFTENHIGNNDIEISEYTKIRAREYVAFAKTFVNSYAWLFPERKVLNFFENIPDGYFETKLFTIYKDGKELERHIKGSE